MNTHVELAQNELSSLRGVIREAVLKGKGNAFRQAFMEMVERGLRPSDYSFLASRLRELGENGAQSAGFLIQRAFLARSTTIEPLLPQLLVEAARAGLYLDCQIGSYGGFIDEMTNREGSLALFDPDLVVFLTDAEDLTTPIRAACARGIPTDFDRETERLSREIADMLRAFRGFSSARLLVQGLVLPDRPVLG